VRRRGRFSNFGAGAIAIVVIVIASYLGFTKTIPFRPHYEIQAAFTDANGIRKSSPVRIAGVEVGRVSKVEPMEKGGSAALVTMRILKKGRPIHEDAQAKIRPRIFLEGNFFVDLSPGTPQAPELSDGETIPIQQTAVPVQFDQLLKALPSQTRGNLRGTLAELFRTYSDGGGSAFNRTLEFQPDAYRFSSIVNEAFLGREPHDLSNWIRDMGTVSAALDRNPEQLKSFITDFNTFANSLAREQGSLQATVRELPRTLRTASPTFDALNRAFPDVRRLARTALPGVRSTRPALVALQPFVTQLRGLVSKPELRGLSADLRQTVPSLTSVARQTVPLLEQLRPLSSCANEVLIPWSKDKVVDERFPASGRVFEEFPKVLPALAGESRSSDANGQWFKVLGTGGVETFTLGKGIMGTNSGTILGTNPPKATRRPPLKPDVPCETQQTPDLRTQVGAGPQRVDTKPDSPAAKERTAKARAVAVEVMNRQMQATLGDKAPTVIDRDATVADVKQLTDGIK
jgi:phospholipid/cholesterol/gamma-HCH transport system substrate-binding protein